MSSPSHDSLGLLPAWARAELVAAAWEIFSALLFVSAVLPAAFETPVAWAVFATSLAASALLARPLARRGERGYTIAFALRAVAWTLAIAPIVLARGPRVLVAGLAFGLMAGGIRRAVYRRVLTDPDAQPPADELRRTLRLRLAESATVAGIVGGHVMLLFAVAFLRTQSRVVFRAWWELLPPLAILATVAFTLALRPATSRVIRALGAGEDGDRAQLLAGLRQAERLPSVLAGVNFAFWFACTAVGVFYFRTGARSWDVGDALTQLVLCSVFAWGVSIYQRAWHKDAIAPVAARLRAWTGVAPSSDSTTLRTRMLRDFGTPLVFTASLSLLSSIGMYRALGSGLSASDDFNAITALFASFTMLIIAAGGIVVRAARELSRPMATLAQAADRAAHGDLDAPVPAVDGPVEVVRLGDSIERMREGLARTIAELERERAGLEANVEARTAELRRALDELRRAQAALVHGERLAMLGELVAGLAHEIHNPLNAIAGAAQPLDRVVEEVRDMLDVYRAAEPDLPFERRRAIEDVRRRIELDATLDDLVGISTVVRRGIDRSVRIVQNLKNFARASGESVPTDLHAGIEETLLLLGPRLRKACIHVVRAYGELPEVVCRPGEINQIFMNLLTNAIQALEAERSAPSLGDVRGRFASDPGPVAFEARASEPPPSRPRAARDGMAEIRIETWVEEGMACVAIADDGPGVPAHLEQRIFDPFFTTKRRGEGTGLGLSISSEIARRHGGSLTLGRPASRPLLADRLSPGGATFVCRIPLRA